MDYERPWNFFETGTLRGADHALLPSCGYGEALNNARPADLLRVVCSFREQPRHPCLSQKTRRQSRQGQGFRFSTICLVENPYRNVKHVTVDLRMSADKTMVSQNRQSTARLPGTRADLDTAPKQCGPIDCASGPQSWKKVAEVWL